MRVTAPGLAGWLAIITAILVTAAVSAVSIAGIRLLRDLAEAEALARVELGAAAAREELRQAADNLLGAARLLGERPTLREILGRTDGDAVAPYLARYCESADLDACAVLHEQAPLAAVGTTLDWPALLADADGQGARAFVSGRDRRSALLVAEAPIAGLAEHGVIAVRHLDSAFSARLGDRVGLEVHIASAGTLDGEDRFTPLHLAALERGTAVAGQVDAIFAASLPVAAAGEMHVLLLATLPEEAVMGPVATMQRRMIMIAIAVAILATAGGILIGRYWIRGVQRLTRAARRIGTGDLAVPVAGEGRAELGVLASTMEEMRRNLVSLTGEIRRRETQAKAVLATISHEFRTPLAAQLASIELLRDGIGEMSPTAQRELVSSLERSVQRLNWLIDNLLESVRIESGQLDIRRRDVDLDEVVDAAREVVEPLAAQRGQRLDLQLPQDLPVVSGDRQRLVQVLVNLLANASKFAPRGSAIRVGAAAREARVTFWVDDEGPGPADPQDTRLFEQFHRAGGEDSAGSGLGLGLFIVHSIVERHGGRVWLERTNDSRTRGPRRRMKILLVDDDPDLLAVIAFALQQAGFLVVRAVDGPSALEVFRQERPDLAVLDINLPGMNGFELAKRIRQQSRIPLIMLTVRNEEEDVVRALELGADDYLTKPFSPRILVARVRALLRRAGIETAGTVTLGSLALQVDDLALDGPGGGRVKLTPLETRLLQLLFTNAGRTVATERILVHVWGNRGGGNRHLLKQLVHRLRHKLEADPANPGILKTVPNAGYLLDPDGIPPAVTSRTSPATGATGRST